jgi:hypothetical protein
VLGVEANPDAIGGGRLDDARDLLETATHAAPRSGAVLHQEPGPPGRAPLDHLTDRRRHLGEDGVEARPQVGPGVKDDPVGVEGGRHLHVVKQ